MASHPHRQTWRTRLSTAFVTRTRTYRSRALVWRLLAPAVFLGAGALFVTSMVSSQGTDLRAGRYNDLGGLASAQARDLAGLQDRAATLNADVDRLSKDLGSTSGDSVQKQAERLRGPAGLEPVRGPGVTVTLDDAPDEALEKAGSGVSELIVHQQDIQAVANALWAGGAEAMTIAGQRVVATTGITASATRWCCTASPTRRRTASRRSVRWRAWRPPSTAVPTSSSTCSRCPRDSAGT